MSKLTDQQSRIVQLLVSGRSQKEAARALGLTPGAVRAHMTKARMRMDANSTSELVYRVLKNKLDEGKEIE